MLGKHKWTQSRLAEHTGINQATISYLISRDKRADDRIGNILTHCWPEQQDNIAVLIEGIRDMIKRWGHDPESSVDMSVAGRPVPKTASERDIDVILRHLKDDGVADLLHDLAVILGRADSSSDKQHPQLPPWQDLSAGSGHMKDPPFGLAGVAESVTVQALDEFHMSHEPVTGHPPQEPVTAAYKPDSGARHPSKRLYVRRKTGKRG